MWTLEMDLSGKQYQRKSDLDVSTGSYITIRRSSGYN